MTAELGQSTDPRALVPGDPEAIFENARVLEGRAKSAIAAGEALKRIDTGGWQGKASDRFHEENQTEVPRWLTGGDTLQKAAKSLNGYAESMVWAQGQAREAVALWQQGEEETEQAKGNHNRAVEQANAENQARASRGETNLVTVPPFSDPGEAKRQAARELLNRAREQLAQVGDETSQLLHDSAQAAPQDSQKQADANFFGGIWSSIKGFGEGLWTLVSDPGATISAMADNITHPVRTLKDMVAWDDWASGHGDRALGKVTGDVLIGAATFGAGKVLKSALKGAEGVRYVRDGPLPDAGRLIDKGQEWTGTGRGGGKMPTEGGPPNGVYYRKDPQTGKVTNYSVYDENGKIIKRVDLEGRSHGGVDTPHVVDYKLNRNPRTGQEFPGEASKLPRPANSDEIP